RRAPAGQPPRPTPSPSRSFSRAEDGIRDRNVTGVQTCALPISHRLRALLNPRDPMTDRIAGILSFRPRRRAGRFIEDSPTATRSDRKSTRLNSSHVSISYAVFCLKKKIIIFDIDG